MRNFIDSTYKLSTAKNFTNIHNKYDLYGVEANDIINLNIKNKDYAIEVLECNHSVPTFGYGFSQKRQKLKEEFLGLQGNDIKKLKDEGVIITKEEVYPLFCYIGDTNITVFNNKKIMKYPVIIIECTYLYEEHRELAYKNQHIYWGDLEKVIEHHKDSTFILYHFSQIYKPEEIRDFFDNNYTNIILWT
jgi:ribonuclease Z